MTNTDKNDFNATIGNTVLSAVHLVPYMPYNLKFYIDMCEFTEGNCKPEIRLLTMGNDVTMCLKYGKPILRPLSDLTVENMKEFSSSNFKRYSEDYLQSILDIYKRDIKTQVLSYKGMQFLFKNHFDVFGLIEKGLAVDINTLSVE